MGDEGVRVRVREGGGRQRRVGKDGGRKAWAGAPGSGVVPPWPPPAAAAAGGRGPPCPWPAGKTRAGR